MEDLVESAEKYFEQGFACSQSVFTPFAGSLGLPAETALKIGAAFEGGMVRQGEVCGAVTGALMAVGLRFGWTSGDDQDAKEITFKLAQEVMECFRAQYGSILCRELLGCDISSENGLQMARDRQLFTTLCPRFVQAAAEKTAEIFANASPTLRTQEEL